MNSNNLPIIVYRNTSENTCALVRVVNLFNNTKIIIPEFYNGKKIVELADNSFKGCAGLASIKIPNGVTIIGESAFEDCESLTSVEIPNSVKSIGKYAFRFCSSLIKITIPSGVTTIDTCAFQAC